MMLKKAGKGLDPVAFFLPSLEGGGAERVMLNLADGFAKRGVRTDLVLGTSVGPYISMVPSDVRLVDLQATRVLRSLRPLIRYLKRERPSALIAALDHANLVAMAATRFAHTKTRTVITIHCTFAKQLQVAKGIRTDAIPWLLGRFHRWADAIVAVSDGVADDTALHTGIPRDRIDVIYNPVITPALLPAANDSPSHPWFCDKTDPIVLGVGRLVAQKNFPLLIDAFAIVRRRRQARLVILGEGPERPALEQRVRQQGLENAVALPGFVANPYACMARADVFVLSSDFEGLPTTLIESLAVGTPVVSTDCESGPREILHDGALGELVPVGDVHALANAIERVLSNPRPAPSPDVFRPYMLESAVDRFLEACELRA
jgi:glycosyltransferase involved in cell wall biosynthesis